jgi:hypothetical protein
MKLQLYQVVCAVVFISSIVLVIVLVLKRWGVGNSHISKKIDDEAYDSGFVLSDITEVVRAVSHSMNYEDFVEADDLYNISILDDIGYQLPDLSAYDTEMVLGSGSRDSFSDTAVYVSADCSAWSSSQSARGRVRLVFLNAETGFVGYQLTGEKWGACTLSEFIDRIEANRDLLKYFTNSPVLKFRIRNP